MRVARFRYWRSTSPTLLYRHGADRIVDHREGIGDVGHVPRRGAIEGERGDRRIVEAGERFGEWDVIECVQLGYLVGVPGVGEVDQSELVRVGI